MSSTPRLRSKLPDVGITIFTVMSLLAAQHCAVNLEQNFPNFGGDPAVGLQHKPAAAACGEILFCEEGRHACL